MISHITGSVVDVLTDSVVVDVHGVGFKLLCSGRTLEKCSVGKPVRLQSYLHVREDALVLFGFENTAERGLFELLIGSVSGVGPKVALGVLSSFTPSDVMNAVMVQDASMLSRAHGVGKKTAERIVMELKDKLGKIPLLPTSVDGAQVVPGTGVAADVFSALTNLGYKPQQAQGALKNAMKAKPEGDFAVLFKTALAELR